MKKKNLEETSVNDASTIEVEVIFIVSPTGKFNLAYNVGETALFNEAQAAELVESGYAEFVK